MRVLHVEANTDGTVGGSHRAMVDLVLRGPRDGYEPVVMFYEDNRHVAELRAEGVEVLVVEETAKAEKSVRRAGGWRKYADFVGAIRRRRHWIRAHRIDLVHLNNSPIVGFDDWLPACLLGGTPCITFAMGDAIVTNRLARFMAPRFDHVIAISDYMGEAMRRLRIPPDRLSVVPLGVDIERLEARATRGRAAMRRELGVDEERVVVAMVGNVRRWKGQHVVLEALAGLDAARRAKVLVLFVGAASGGDQAYVAELEAFVAAHGLGANVRFLGARSDVPDVLRAADIALHASIAPEPFGLVVPEAMALGLPVVAARFGGPGEVVSPESGRLFDPAQPAELTAILAELVDDPQLRRAMGAAAAHRVQQFSVQAMVAGVHAVYGRVRRR